MQTISQSDIPQGSIFFSITKHYNQSGHQIFKISANILGINLEGTVYDPPPVPKDYMIVPEMGYYKYHDEKVTFEKAQSICNAEGGHLAIIDSEKEADILKTIPTTTFSYVGFHDRAKEGHFTTIFGEPIKYAKWMNGEPNNLENEDCVVMNTDGHINDAKCSSAYSFICEYNLAWAEY